MCQGVHSYRFDHLLVHEVLQTLSQKGQPAARQVFVHGAVGVPVEHGRGVDHHDLLQGRVRAGLQKGIAPGDQSAPGIIVGLDTVADFQLGLFEHRVKQVFFALKVMIEGAARDLGFLYDGLRGGTGIAFPAEFLHRHRQQAFDGGRRLRFLTEACFFFQIFLLRC